MKLLVRDYFASLREREELDAILPDLLSELGYMVYSRPQRGTAQAGVDIAAVGKDDNGERKLFLFSVKQGDLTRQSWDGTPQALRSSLNEILDTYIHTRIPKRYQKLKIVICLVFGGDVQEQVRGKVVGFTKRNSTKRISFDEWNGDKLAELLLRGVLREKIMPKPLRSHFQKAVAMVDEPAISYEHFSQLAHELCKTANSNKARVRTARQLYIGLWVLFVWARDGNNVEAPYRASELSLLHIWSLLKPYIGRPPNSTNKSITSVLQHAIHLHITIASELLERKIAPHVGARDAISSAVRTRSYVDINLKLFDLLGRIALVGLWVHWLIDHEQDEKRKAAAHNHIARLVTTGIRLIQSNRALFLPLQDQQAIEISLFLMLARALNVHGPDVRAWLREMTNRLDFTVRTHGRYPCVFGAYHDLAAHPQERTDAYRKEATSASILIPLLAVFLSAFGDQAALETLVSLKEDELDHCTLQLWTPDASSEEGFFAGTHDHGVALSNLPLSASGSELLKFVKDACEASKDFDNLTAIKTGFWPIILTACRHYRLPVPPQFWLGMIDEQQKAP
jgi:hypothetical protein